MMSNLQFAILMLPICLTLYEVTEHRFIKFCCIVQAMWAIAAAVMS
jgi:hypothetical protein